MALSYTQTIAAYPTGGGSYAVARENPGTLPGLVAAAALLIPEFVPARWWHNILHNQSAWLLRLALLYRRHHLGKSRAIIDVPFYLER